jgi:hypothetical protein
MIIRIVLKILSIILVIHGVGSFLQSFRKEDSFMTLLKDGIYEDPKKTSFTLRIIGVVSFIIGIILISI